MLRMLRQGRLQRKIGEIRNVEFRHEHGVDVEKTCGCNPGGSDMCPMHTLITLQHLPARTLLRVVAKPDSPVALLQEWRPLRGQWPTSDGLGTP